MLYPQSIVFLCLLVAIYQHIQTVGASWTPFHKPPSSPPRVPLTLSQEDSIQSLDLASLLHESQLQTLQQNALFSSALQILNSMKAQPSCNKHAASDLVISCQSVDAGYDTQNYIDSRESAVFLDMIRSLYAARLALCELRGAGAQVPEQCSSIAVLEPSSFAYADYSHTEMINHLSLMRPHIEYCLQTLEMKPQWWTSYSNNRQNAVIMCDAARIEIEKEERLSHYENFANVTSMLSSLMNETFTSASQESAKQMGFLQLIEKMRINLSEALSQDESKYRDMFSDVLLNVEALQRFISNTDFGVASLEKDLKSSASTAQQLEGALARLLTNKQRLEDEFSEKQHQDYQHNLDLMSSISEQLELVKGKDITAMALMLDETLRAMDNLDEFLNEVQGRHQGINVQMQNMDKKLYQLENRAVALQTIQLQHYDNHSRAHREMHDDLRISQAILAQIQSSAASLQSSIDEAQFSFEHLPSFNNILQTILGILPCAALLCVMAFLFPGFAGRLLSLVVIGLYFWAPISRNGVSWLSKSFKSHNGLSWFSENAAVMMEAFALGCFATLAITRTCNYYYHRRRFTSDGHAFASSKTGELPIRV